MSEDPRLAREFLAIWVTAKADPPLWLIKAVRRERAKEAKREAIAKQR